ncbi:SGNH/GDSL hydrolase family protein [Metamycoplasma equirhinis]|uniref:SGNH/GDSL hydrolase family protein n=1 Tax=Metamycoplasma equirhinis TaxID=92402 RepID=UPI003593866B
MNKKTFNFLSIGDSIAQGFNSKLGCGSCGFKIGNELASGYSYGDYFTLLLKDYCEHNNYSNFWQNFNYENYASSVMRINDVINLLDKKEDFAQEFINLIQINKDIEKFADIQIQENVWSLEGHLSVKENFEINSNRLSAAIKKSDLISISIGGNEFQSSFSFALFNKILNEHNIYKQLKLKQKLYEKLRDLGQKIGTQYKNMMLKIRQINSEANIILLSYIPPFMPFLTSYEKSLKKINPVVYEDLFKQINIYLNETIRDACIDRKCHFLKVFSFSYWKKHVDILCENLFDVHPTENGYKQIARTLFAYVNENNLIFDSFNQGYLKRIKNCSIKKLNYKFNRIEQKITKIFSLPNNVNHIVYILRAWLDKKNTVQNPYFALFKRETKELLENYEATNNIAKREDYVSLSSLTLERLIFILKLFPKDAKLSTFIRNEVITDENVLKLFNYLLRSETMIKILYNCEFIYIKNKKQKLATFLNAIFKENAKNVYLLFKEWYEQITFESKQNIKQMINLLNDDFKNHNSIIFNNYSVTKLINKMSYDTNVVEKFKILSESLGNSFELNNLKKYIDFDEFFTSFIVENEKTIKEIFVLTIKFIDEYSHTNLEDFSEIITNIIRINHNELSFKEWKHLNKIITKIQNTLNNEKSVEYMANVLYKIMKSISLYKSIDFRKLSKIRYISILAKKFLIGVTTNIFNKTNLKLIGILLQIFGLKLRHKIRKF